MLITRLREAGAIILAKSNMGDTPPVIAAPSAAPSAIRT